MHIDVLNAAEDVRGPVFFALAVGVSKLRHPVAKWRIKSVNVFFHNQTRLREKPNVARVVLSRVALIFQVCFLHLLTRRSTLHFFSLVRDRNLPVRFFASPGLSSDSTSFAFLAFAQKKPHK